MPQTFHTNQKSNHFQKSTISMTLRRLNTDIGAAAYYSFLTYRI